MCLERAFTIQLVGLAGHLLSMPSGGHSQAWKMCNWAATTNSPTCYFIISPGCPVQAGSAPCCCVRLPDGFSHWMGDKIVASKDITSRATTTLSLSGCLLCVLVQRALSRAWSRGMGALCCGVNPSSGFRDGANPQPFQQLAQRRVGGERGRSVARILFLNAHLGSG